MKSKIIILAIAFLMLLATSFASDTEQLNFVLDDYYKSYANQDMEKFMSYSIYPQNSAEYNDVKKILNSRFQDIEILSYSLSNVKIDTYKNAAIIEYFLQMKLANGQDIVILDDEMKAIMLKVDSSWKVYMIAEKEIIDHVLKTVNIEKGLEVFDKTIEEDEPKEIVKSGCGDNICDIGESCISDCGFEEFTKTCGDGTCSENEDCPYDCSEKQIIDLTSGMNQKKECELPFNIKSIDDKKLSEYELPIPTWVKDQVLTDKTIKLIIDDKEHDIRIQNDTVNIINTQDYDYKITTDSCTISSIINGDLTFNQAYESERISLESQGITNNIKTWIGKVFYSIYSFFKPAPIKIIIEGEDAKLMKPGRYSFIGTTSRGPGELYLGTGGSYAEYEIENTIDGAAYIYLILSDDAKHRDGTRDANIYFDEQLIEYKHKSFNSIAEGKYWDRIYLGETKLKEGKLKIKIEKPKQTSAAFVMDKMIISDTLLP